MYGEGDPAISRRLAFPAHLRADPQVTDEYEALEREVFARQSDDILAYNDGENAWIKRVEQISLEWFERRGRA